MFMQKSAEEVSWPIGIQHASHVSGREHLARLHDGGIFSCAPCNTIELDKHQSSNTQQIKQAHHGLIAVGIHVTHDLNNIIKHSVALFAAGAAVRLVLSNFFKTALCSTLQQVHQHLETTQNCLLNIITNCGKGIVVIVAAAAAVFVVVSSVISAETPSLVTFTSLPSTSSLSAPSSLPLPSKLSATQSSVRFEIIQILISNLLYVPPVFVVLSKVEFRKFDTFIRLVFIGLSLLLIFVSLVVTTSCIKNIINLIRKRVRVTESSSSSSISKNRHGVLVYATSFFVVFVVAITVRTLYAGTLVANRTTAPCHHNLLRSISILLATLCLILATLTIAARCYASTSTTHSIVQLTQHPDDSFSPILIKYSNSQLHTSKIVLSRLFPNPRKSIQSDTSVIETNSKSINRNQNYVDVSNKKRSKLKALLRRKRDYHRSSNIQLEKLYNFKLKEEDNSLRFNSEAKEHESTAATAIGISEKNKIPHRNSLSESFHYHHQSTPHIISKSADNAIINHNIVATQLEITTNSNNIPYSKNNNNNNKALPPTHKYNNIELLKNSEEEEQTELVPVLSVSARNKSVNSSRVASTFVVDHQHLPSFETVIRKDSSARGPERKRPMPPAHDHGHNSLSENSVLVLVVAVVVLTVALGLVTCVLSHYRGGTAANPHDFAHTPTTAPMLSVVSAGATAGVGGMDRLRGRGAARELAASRDRQVRLHAVHTDIAINLPPSISLPDGEEHPFSSRLHIRDTEQESEIYQKCIRPPPNRTVLESESPPPYRSSSAGLLGSIGGSSSGSSDWSGGSAPLVVRCHSMSSTSKRPEAGSSGQKTDFLQKTVKIFTGKRSQPSPAPTLPPVVIVPSRTRRTTEQQNSTTGRPKPNV